MSREQAGAGGIVSQWLNEKKKNPGLTAEEFARRRYMEIHREDPGTDQEKREFFDRRAQAWKENGENFCRFADRFCETPQTRKWQAAEMLDNVISEYRMDRREQFRYLANVKLELYYSLLRFLDPETSRQMQAVFEETYEEEWEKADGKVTEKETEELFAETVSLMCYAGVGYNDETRSILAHIGVGDDDGFHQEFTGQIKKDLLFLSDFVVSETVLSGTDEPCTQEEQNTIAEQIVPVCVSSASMICEGSDASHVMKLTHSYLGKLLEGKGRTLLAMAATVLVAAKIAYHLAVLAVVGKMAEAGLRHLWKYCREAEPLGEPKEKETVYRELSKRAGISEEGVCAQSEEERARTEYEERTEEERFEHV